MISPPSPQAIRAQMAQVADLWSLLELRTAATPDTEALVDQAGRRITFAQLRTASEALAAGLAGRGVRQGDTVAWELPTSVEAVELALALARIGVRQVPIIPIYRDREVRHCCRETGARWLITGGEFRGYDFAALGARLAADLGLTHLRVDGVAPSDPTSLLAAEPAPDDDRWVFYTSGTTAAPKVDRKSVV